MDHPSRWLRFRLRVVLVLPVPFIIVMLLFFAFVHNVLVLLLSFISGLLRRSLACRTALYNSVPDNPELLP